MNTSFLLVHKIVMFEVYFQLLSGINRANGMDIWKDGIHQMLEININLW